MENKGSPHAASSQVLTGQGTSEHAQNRTPISSPVSAGSSQPRLTAKAERDRQARLEREARALRANLARRKRQQRDMARQGSQLRQARGQSAAGPAAEAATCASPEPEATS
ncbi:hypothetical protein [Oecophyllibacter saccharovorans]|uniref:Uncharacterized protein n=1 Tax=Oecophyllibacter saccharovorans TaxID=2558360 RepID=A0A506URT7_9PROT|nr:hypothetical protein E3202_03980 [Oecophyllibacter saccharovorans]